MTAVAELKKVQKKFGSQAMLVAIGIAVILILAGAKAEGKGVLLGALFSVLNFVLMSAAMPLRVGLSTKKSFIFSLGSIWVRYLILSIPLILALKSDSLNILTTAAGLFTVQALILVNHVGSLIGGRLSKKRSTV